jgi:acetyl-CoA decarbonylase/synthase complex subunit gamma
VAAHEVKERTGFRVVYGPVRAEEIPAFLEAGMKATEEMRRVRFPLRDRLAVAPMEMVAAAKYFLPVAAVIALLGLAGIPLAAAPSVAAILAAWLGGALLVPALLPWLPGRAFASKGAWAGAGIAVVLAAWWLVRPGSFENGLTLLAWVLMVPAAVSFLGMNFTGSSTYTSLSGVRREMRLAVPLQIGCAVAGLGLWVAGRIVGA